MLRPIEDRLCGWWVFRHSLDASDVRAKVDVCKFHFQDESFLTSCVFKGTTVPKPSHLVTVSNQSPGFSKRLVTPALPFAIGLLTASSARRPNEAANHRHFYSVFALTSSKIKPSNDLPSAFQTISLSRGTILLGCFKLDRLINI